MDHLTDDDYMQICLERDRLLASGMFMRAPVIVKLLQYLVEQKLNDSDHDIKSYSIAVEALGRSSDFDTDADSYPRVQVGRLRKLMNQFFAKSPSAVRLTVPLGVYRVLFEQTAGPAQSVDSVMLFPQNTPTPALHTGAHPDHSSVQQDVRDLSPTQFAAQTDPRLCTSELAEMNRVQIAALKNRQTVFISFIALLFAWCWNILGHHHFAMETTDRTLAETADGVARSAKMHMRASAWVTETTRNFHIAPPRKVLRRFIINGVLADDAGAVA